MEQNGYKQIEHVLTCITFDTRMKEHVVQQKANFIGEEADQLARNLINDLFENATMMNKNGHSHFVGSHSVCSGGNISKHLGIYHEECR